MGSLGRADAAVDRETQELISTGVQESSEIEIDIRGVVECEGKGGGEENEGEVRKERHGDGGRKGGGGLVQRLEKKDDE